MNLESVGGGVARGVYHGPSCRIVQVSRQERSSISPRILAALPTRA